MWRGVFPAVTTKFTEGGDLDLAEMERCFGLQVDAGVDGMIVCGSLGENMTLEPEEKLEILKVARSAAGSKPVLMTVCESSTTPWRGGSKGCAKAGASGFMVLPGVPYKSNPEETLAHVQAVAAAGGLPIMVYNNPIAYGVDVTIPMFEELAKNDLVVAMKELTDDIRRVTDVFNAFGERFDVLHRRRQSGARKPPHGRTWLGRRSRRGLPEGDGCDLQARSSRSARRGARHLPLVPPAARPRCLDLPRPEHQAGGSLCHQSNDRVRAPRLPLSGGERQRVVAIIEKALASRPELPKF